MKYARTFVKVIFGLFMLDSCRNWIQWTFFTDAAKEFFQVQSESIWGLNMLKTDMTAGVATSGVFVLLYFLRGKQWLPPAIVLVSVFIVTRLLSMAIDGTTGMLWAGIAYEVTFLAAAVFLLKTEPETNS